MAITHAKVSGAGPSPNPALVGGDDWDDDHEFDPFTDADIAAANKDGVAGTPSMRTLGTGAQQAAAGNHTHTGVYQPSDATLTALAALASNGLAEITGGGATAAVRAAASSTIRAGADARLASCRTRAML